jgi:hypothetical protein
MPAPRRRRRCPSGGAIALSLVALVIPGAAQASGPPVITEAWASAVFSSTARLSAKINPNGLSSSYHFDYITKAAYDANGGNFSGALRSPAVSDAGFGSGTNPVGVLQILSGLAPETAWRYRLVAKNSAGTTTGEPLPFVTQGIGGGLDTCSNNGVREQQHSSFLPDCRGWEMVSPVDKNGGQVDPPEGLADGGVLQAAADGQSVGYGSRASFAGGQGAPPASQYISTRIPGVWSTRNITAPIFSGTYDAEDEGVPWQLFSADLGRGLLLNGDHCRGEAQGCAVANPPLSGTDAPAGYQDYYLRDSGSGGFTALLGAINAGFLSLEPRDFDIRFAGASPDLLHGVLSTCAALSANAMPVGGSCDPEEPNLYEYATGGALTLVNLKPGDSVGTPGAKLAAQSGAVSSDGSRVYFSLEGDLYLRSGGQTKQADEDAGGGGSFETASTDGSVAFFSKGEHLWRYLVGTDTAGDLTPSGGVKGVLGASTAGDWLYFQDATALKLWHSGVTTTVASGAGAAQASDWPPTTGTARVSADGTKLLFLSAAKLGEFDNTDLSKGTPDSQVYLYDASGATSLTCVSCNPTFGRPIGPSSIPGSVPNGSTEASTDSYKPRSLSANGRRVFFDSKDALVSTDTDNDKDAYEWEAQGEGGCTRAGGCIALISSGRSAGGASFIDASADGSGAFFLTEGSLVSSDPGASDLYDARIGGGFPDPIPPIICEGDACQPLPSPPVDPTLTTLLSGPGNPGVRYPKARCPKGKVRRKGRCVLKGKRHAPKRHLRSAR